MRLVLLRDACQGGLVPIADLGLHRGERKEVMGGGGLLGWEWRERKEERLQLINIFFHSLSKLMNEKH